jgi:hypothetical protein
MKQAALGRPHQEPFRAPPRGKARASLTIAGARERAIEITLRHGAQPSRVRLNVLQRRRLAMRLSRITNRGPPLGLKLHQSPAGIEGGRTPQR